MANFPTCVTCKQPFTYAGPKPNLLPCLHSVCDDCVKSTTENLKCCTCVTDFIKDNISVARDVVREKEIFHLTAKHRPSELLCTNKDDGNQAVSWCQDCREMFCEHCQISHDEVKVTRQHKMKQIEELDNNVTLGENPLICPKHHDQLMDLYDKTCHKPICFKCLYQDHSSHETVGIKEHVLSAMKTIQNHLKSVKEYKQHVTGLETTLVYDEDTLQKRTILLRDNIRQTFGEFRSLVDQRLKEVLLEFDQCVEVVEEQRKSVVYRLQKKSTECKTREDYLQAAVHYLSPPDAALSVDKLLEVTSVTGEDLPRTDNRNMYIIFNKENVDKIKTLLTSFGSFLSSRDSSDHKNITVHSIKKTSSASPKAVSQTHTETTETTSMSLWSRITSESTAVTMDKEKVNKAQVIYQSELINRFTRTSMSLL